LRPAFGVSALLAVMMLLSADDFDKRCIATDESGAVLAEALDDDALACRERLKARLAEAHCRSAGQPVPYRYQRGRGRAVAAVLYCR
jgi:hypothetical protein